MSSSIYHMTFKLVSNCILAWKNKSLHNISGDCVVEYRVKGMYNDVIGCRDQCMRNQALPQPN